MMDHNTTHNNDQKRWLNMDSFFLNPGICPPQTIMSWNGPRPCPLCFEYVNWLTRALMGPHWAAYPK